MRINLLKIVPLVALLVALVAGTASADVRKPPQFAPPQNYDNLGAGQPQNLAKGDFDEDGILDLVMAVGNSTDQHAVPPPQPNGGVSLFKGNPDGTFDEPSEQLDVAPFAIFVIESDFNNDGHLDLAISNFAAKPFDEGTIVVLLGNGDGTFESGGTFPSGGVQPVGLADPDFDKDGDKDLAVANSGNSPLDDLTGYTNNVTILENVGGGDFETKQTISMERGQGPLFFAKGNFDRGGHPDLVVSNAGADTVTLLVNKKGTYESTQPNGIGRGDDPQGIVAGYLNDDRNLDVATANANTSNVSVLLGNGDGTFKDAVVFSSGGVGPVSLVAADFNDDGKKVQDLAVTNIGAGPGGGGNVGVLSGRGDGTFEAPETFPAGDGPAGIVAGKFDRGKKVDLAVANVFSTNGSSSLSVLINETQR